MTTWQQRIVGVGSVLLVFAAVLVAACSDDEETEAPDAGESDDVAPSEDTTDEPMPPLVSPSLWAQVSADDDPLADERPEEVDCPDEAIKTETLDGQMSYAVDMGQCNYLVVSQSSLLPVEAGDTLRARIWHFDLTPAIGGDDGQAHVAILFDGDIAWETAIDIPADGQLLSPEWEAERDYPQGTEVFFHLRNHGENQWNFIELVRVED